MLLLARPSGLPGASRRQSVCVEALCAQIARFTFRLPLAMAAVEAAAAPADRLMISKIETENFKSYGGVKVLGPFHKRMTCIVGPNGSGKSNSLDALVFAFGKRASKLRLKKLSELIHKSEAYPDCTFCRVSVTFQRIVDTGPGDEDFDVVPGSQFVVTREAYKPSGSKYLVNGKGASFTEVNELLVSHGVDLVNNRFLILQGEVEAISMMKPKGSDKGDEGLLEYLEEIIGSNKYIAPIAEAGEKLAQFDELRSEKLARVRVAEKEKGGLESAKVEAEEYLDKQRGMLTAQSALLQVHVKESSEAVAAAKSKRAGLAERLETERERLAAAEQQVGELAEEHGSVTSALSAARKEAEAHRKAYTDCEKQDIKLRAEVKAAKAKAKKAEKALASHAEKAEAAAKEGDALSSKLPELELRVEEATERKAAAEAELQAVYDGLKDKSSGLREALEAAQADLAPWAEQVTQASAEKAQAETALSILREQTQGAAAELAKVQDTIKALTQELSASQQRLEKAEAAAEAAAASLQAAKARLQEAEAAYAQAEAAAKAARGIFEDKKEALSATSSRGALLSGLMSATAPGKPLASAGLAGRLGDLGTIDPKYDVAVSTACGALNWLVVDTVEGGQACVEYLRSRRLGRAKFIMLDKIGWAAEGMAKSAGLRTPEGVPRLFDLITPVDEKYSTAFYYGLRNTLVAEDLDQAVRIAYVNGKCRWRVVTLAGEMIDTSGTMSGGGKTVRKGFMRTAAPAGAAAARGSASAPLPAAASIVTPQDVAEAEQQLSVAMAALTAARTERDEATTALASAEEAASSATLQELRQVVSTLTVKLQAAEREAATLEQEAAAAGDLSAADEAALADAEAALEAATKAHAKACAHAAKYETKVAALEAKLAGVGGDSVAGAKKAVSAATAALDASRRAVAKAKAEFKQSAKAAEKAAAAIAKCEADAEASRAKVAELKAAQDALVEDATAALAARDTAAAAEEEARGAAADVGKRLDAVRSTLQGIRDTELDIATAMQEVDTVLSAATATVAKYEKQLSDVHRKYETCLDMCPAEEDEEDAEAADGAAAADVGGAATAVPRKPPTLSEEELASASKDQMRATIAVLESEMKALEGDVNLAAIAEYRAKEREWIRRVGELEGVSQARDKSKREFDALRSKRLDDFMAGFRVITLKLKEMYQMITLGGDAELELVDSLDPFSEGIVFSVRPPKKSWKNISNLSGGEKTLSSLALVFALHHYKPTPLYVMDEIDAALDFRNVSIVANYIKERTQDAQFIIISLRNNMFELADRLVGIYKTHDVTKNVTINPKAFAATAGSENPAASAAGGGKLAVRAPAAPAEALGDSTNVA